MQPMLSAQTRKGGAGSLEEYTDSLLPYDVKQALGYKADHILSFDDLHEFAMHCQEEE